MIGEVLLEIRKLEEALVSMRAFATAEREALGGRDYSLSAYILRDLPVTKAAELSDLCYAMSEGNASRGDWDRLKLYWLSALLAEKETPTPSNTPASDTPAQS